MSLMFIVYILKGKRVRYKIIESAINILSILLKVIKVTLRKIKNSTINTITPFLNIVIF